MKLVIRAGPAARGFFGAQGTVHNSGEKEVTLKSGATYIVRNIKKNESSYYKHSYEVEVDLIHGEGVSLENELLDLGSANGVVEKSGSWFSFRGERLGQGREQSRIFLKENTAIRATIESELRLKLGIAQSEPARKVLAAAVAAGAGRATAPTQ